MSWFCWAHTPTLSYTIPSYHLSSSRETHLFERRKEAFKTASKSLLVNKVQFMHSAHAHLKVWVMSLVLTNHDQGTDMSHF